MGLFSKKSKEEKAREKAIEKEIKQMMKEEEELEKSIPREKFNIIELLKEKDEEPEDLKQYMTEEELEDAAKEDRFLRRLTIIGVGTIVFVLVASVVGVFVLNHAFQSDLVKYVIPKMQTYYLEKYGVETKIEKDNIKEICHDEVDAEGKKQNVCPGTVLAVTNDGTYIYSLDQKEFSDSRVSNSIASDYNDRIKSYFDGIDFIGNSPSFSYKDFYEKYNSFIPYIGILPNGKNFDELYSTNKLTVRDMILYSGDMYFGDVKSFLDSFSEDSMVVFINSIRGIPSGITVYRNKEIKYYDLSTKSLITENIGYYELDTTLNGVPDFSVNEVLAKTVTTNSNYSIVKPYKITFTKPRVGRNEEPKTNYYFVEFNSDMIPSGKMIQFNPTGSEEYREIDFANYTDFMKLSLGNSTYVFGDEPIGFGLLKFKSKNHCYLEFCSGR